MKGNPGDSMSSLLGDFTGRKVDKKKDWKAMCITWDDFLRVRVE
jgi:hypothetical protein